MIPRDNTGRQFSEDIEKLLQGEEPLERRGDEDYAETVLFARRLMQLREEPDPEFAVRLRRNLLTNMAAQDAQAGTTDSRFMRLFSRPGLRLAVVSTFIVLAAVGLVWRAGFMAPSSAPPDDSQPGMLTAPAPVMTPEAAAGAQAPRAMEDSSRDAVGAVAPSAPPSAIVVAVSTAPSASPGEDIDILVTFSNHSSDGYLVTPFPPAVAIREATTGRVVYTFAYGPSSYVLSGMELLQWEVVWNQQDSNGRQVEPGRYEVEVETMHSQLEKGEAIAWTNAYGVVWFEILPSATQGEEANSAMTIQQDIDPEQEES